MIKQILKVTICVKFALSKVGRLTILKGGIMKQLVIIFSLLATMVLVSNGQELKEVDGIYYSDNKPFTGKSVLWYENGKIRMESSFINGEKDGQFRLYHENGILHEIREYKHNEMHGTWITWNGKGIKIGEASYQCGKKHGKWFVWDDKGNLVYEMNYQDGEKSGIWKRYDESGVLLSSREF
jgi:antitoxin component YwqK of YwqJK toxin-antitoxin module